MDHKKRLLTALSRQIPDRVPIWELGYNEASIVGIASRFVEPDKLPEPKIVADMDGREKLLILSALVEIVKTLDIDSVTAFSLAPKERVDKNHVRDAFGVVSRLSPLGEPHPVKGPIRDASDLATYRMRKPEPGDFLMLEVLKQALPGRAVALDLQGAFRLSWGLRGGMEALLMDYLLNPALAHELALRVTDYCLAFIDAALDKGADWILLDGDLAFNAGPLMSPAHYDEFIGPYHQRMVELAHRRGALIAKHSDGDLTRLLPSLAAAGFDGIHPLQPQNMDIGKVKAEWGSRFCLIGNIDCSRLLVDGTEAEVEETVRRTIEIAGPGGGYIVSSSNSIHPEVNPDNYLAMVRAAHRHGKIY